MNSFDFTRLFSSAKELEIVMQTLKGRKQIAYHSDLENPTTTRLIFVSFLGALLSLFIAENEFLGFQDAARAEEAKK